MKTREEIQGVFKAMRVPLTHQRLAVYEELAGRTDHPSAESLYESLKKSYPSLSLATVYKKLTMYTHENVGWGKIHLPEQELQTTSYWLSLAADAAPGWPRERVEVALAGLGNLLHGLAPLFLMCDPHDLGLSVEVRSPHTERPTLYLFDMTPGGVGFSERLFRATDPLLERAREHLAACPCESGCPACVGPAYAIGQDVKAAVAELIA